MPGYLSAIIDKSVLQLLSAREAKWLFHHFRVNIPPVLFSEVLGDLAKTKHLATGSADGDVRMLANKIVSHSIFLNDVHDNLIAAELHGYGFPMDGRPIPSNSKAARMPDGSIGLYIDQTPLQRVMDRWVAGDFHGMEVEFAKVWRADQKMIDLEALIRTTKHFWDGGRASLKSVSEAVNASLFGPGRDYSHLDTLMLLAGAQPSHRAKALRRWHRSGRPAPIRFAPYTSFVARLEATFIIGLHAGFVTTRSTNRVDVEYFKYLPFTEVFASGDDLHATLFPAFARVDQTFMPGRELKASLQAMADYYDGLPGDQKQLGSMTYADYPPVSMDNVVTKVFDRKIPGWREGANQAKPPRDKSGDAALLAEMKTRLNWLKANAR